MEKIRAMGLRNYAGDESRFHVKKRWFFSIEIMDEDILLDGLKPTKPSRLPESIAQFLEVRLVALHKCTTFKWKLLSLDLDQVRFKNL